MEDCEGRTSAEFDAITIRLAQIDVELDLLPESDLSESEVAEKIVKLYWERRHLRAQLDRTKVTSMGLLERKAAERRLIQLGHLIDQIDVDLDAPSAPAWRFNFAKILERGALVREEVALSAALAEN